MYYNQLEHTVSVCERRPASMRSRYRLPPCAMLYSVQVYVDGQLMTRHGMLSGESIWLSGQSVWPVFAISC